MSDTVKVAVIIVSEKGFDVATTISQELQEDVALFSVHQREGVTTIDSIKLFVEHHFTQYDALIFIGAMGICVRSIAPCLNNKYADPAVLNVDATGRFVVSVVSGHVGGGNALTQRVARLLGAEAVVTTQSDNTDLWALDLLGSSHGWKAEHEQSMNALIALFVNQRPTALLLDVKDRGTAVLERTLPPHVDLFYRFEEIPLADYALLIAVTPVVYDLSLPTLYFRPPVLHLGIGCRRLCRVEGGWDAIVTLMQQHHLSPRALCSVSTIDLKKDEPLVAAVAAEVEVTPQIYTADDLRDIEVPNPSKKVFEVTGSWGVAEAAALRSAGGGRVVMEKEKIHLSEGDDLTFALVMAAAHERRGFIEIVGAGPGDPELISVRGKYMLERADLILYAGSLVPEELTAYAKQGATVRNSAAMDLEEQFALMKTFYDRGLFVVRLHTGDPCIYGAIQEQMAYFDDHKMDYHITPGISSFQAAAAALRSQFTIPEKVQTVILTRGEGRTLMPEKEKLHLLARSQSTMCLFLSAGVVEKVQEELLMHYPPTTPVAACYHLTWRDERIYRGELCDLAKIVKENDLTLTTMIVVGEAIGNRHGRSQLYAHSFKHLFRPE